MIETYREFGAPPDRELLGIVAEEEPVEIQFGQEYSPITPEEALALAARLEEHPDLDHRFTSRTFRVGDVGAARLCFEVEPGSSIVKKTQAPDGQTQYVLKVNAGSVAIDLAFDEPRGIVGFGCTLRIGTLQLYSPSNSDQLKQSDPEGTNFSFWTNTEGEDARFRIFAEDLGEVTVRFDPYPQQPT